MHIGTPVCQTHNLYNMYIDGRYVSLTQLTLRFPTMGQSACFFFLEPDLVLSWDLSLTSIILSRNKASDFRTDFKGTEHIPMSLGYRNRIRIYVDG